MKVSFFVISLLLGIIGLTGISSIAAQSPQDLIPFSQEMFRSKNFFPTSPSREDAEEINRFDAEAPAPYQPGNPSDWGAPGNPNSQENVDFSGPNGEFTPEADPDSPDLAELFEKASKTEPIPLKGNDKFITQDRVRLNAVYYKGNADKTTIPILLLHDKGGKKEDMQPLAEKLSAAGFAVLIPDLRGHGESTTSWIYDYSSGGDRPAIREKEDYIVDSFTEDDFSAMRQYDGLLWYQFLLVLHQEGKINLRRLVLIGNGYGAAVASAWLAYDWQEPSPKKGRFAKNIIFLSPDADAVYKSVSNLKGRASLTGLIFVGNLIKRKQEDSEKIQLTLGKEKAATPPEERQFELISIKTEKEGMELLSIESFGVADRILQFINAENQENAVGEKWTPIKF